MTGSVADMEIKKQENKENTKNTEYTEYTKYTKYTEKPILPEDKILWFGIRNFN